MKACDMNLQLGRLVEISSTDALPDHIPVRATGDQVHLLLHHDVLQLSSYLPDLEHTHTQTNTRERHRDRDRQTQRKRVTEKDRQTETHSNIYHNRIWESHNSQ